MFEDQNNEMQLYSATQSLSDQMERDYRRYPRNLDGEAIG